MLLCGVERFTSGVLLSLFAETPEGAVVVTDLTFLPVFLAPVAFTGLVPFSGLDSARTAEFLGTVRDAEFADAARTLLFEVLGPFSLFLTCVSS